MTVTDTIAITDTPVVDSTDVTFVVGQPYRDGTITAVKTFNRFTRVTYQISWLAGTAIRNRLVFI